MLLMLVKDGIERRRRRNTNRLIRQYLPKGTSMHAITELDCNLIADALNARPRKRLNYQTSQECFDED